MSDRGDPVQQSTPVHLVPAPAPRGISQNGLLQSLQREGVTRGVIPDGRATQITDFIGVFDKSNVLSPVIRRTANVDNTLLAPAPNVDVQIVAPVNEILVIRALTWEVAFGTVNVPGSLEIRFIGKEAGVASLIPFMTSTAPIPLSNRVIGDDVSPLTALFLSALPIALLPGDILRFRQTASPFVILGSRVVWFQETYLAPFRPPGL